MHDHPYFNNGTLYLLSVLCIYILLKKLSPYKVIIILTSKIF